MKHKRLNITLPEATVKTIDRVTGAGTRSRFIDQAVKHYLQEFSKVHLRQALRDGALAQANRDLGMVEDWFLLEEEVWPAGRK